MITRIYAAPAVKGLRSWELIGNPSELKQVVFQMQSLVEYTWDCVTFRKNKHFIR